MTLYWLKFNYKRIRKTLPNFIPELPDSLFIGAQKYLVIICKSTDDHNKCITSIWFKIESKAKKPPACHERFAHCNPHECMWLWCSASEVSTTDWLGSVIGDKWLLVQVSNVPYWQRSFVGPIWGLTLCLSVSGSTLSFWVWMGSGLASHTSMENKSRIYIDEAVLG